MLKELFKRRSSRIQERDIVAGPNSLPVSVNVNGDKRTVNVGVDGLSEGEKKELYARAAGMSDIAVYEGYIEHAYAKSHVHRTDQCPQCGAITQRRYGHFIYATQIATRVMFAPAGYFCTECPSVIIDEDIIRNGITDRKFRFQGVLGIDYGKERKPDIFRTWNGREAVYVLDEDLRPMGISTFDSGHSHPQASSFSINKKQRRNASRRKLAKKSRRINRRK
jgi:hypothetical protein